MAAPSPEFCAARTSAWRARVAALRQQGEDLRREVERLHAEAVEVRAAEAVLRTLLDRSRGDDDAQVAAVATRALRDVFADQELTAVLRARTWRDQPALDVLLRDEVRGVEGDPLDSFGGGPAVLLGVLFQVVALRRRPELAPLIVLDETLDRVSAGGYGAAAAFLLVRIAREFGIDFLVITHAAELAAGADRVYRLDGGRLRSDAE
jgi:hypothetical protein